MDTPSRRRMFPSFLGIDPSFTGTGVIVLSRDAVLHQELIKTNEKDHIVDRFMHIRSRLSFVISEFNPELISIEGMAFAATGKGAFGAGYLGYGLRQVLMLDLGRPFIEPAPTAVKKFAAGSGSGGKDVIMMNVYKRWGEEFTVSDLADAYVLARIGQAYKGRQTYDLIKPQQEVIDVIKKGVKSK